MLIKSLMSGRSATLFGASALALTVSLATGSAHAQTENNTNSESGDSTVVVVTGYRASLQKSLAQKKRSDAIIDVITAEDVGKFPESNLSEALQRLPGISIERDNGEGRTITVRGLGGDFVRTRLNGMETTATAGVNEGQTAINRSRGFDYNVFATDMFSTLKVLKSAEASVDEGSLGATVDLETGRPLDQREKRKLVLSIQDSYYVNDGKGSPRYAAAYSEKFFGGKLGVSVTGAYNKRESGLSSFFHNVGAIDYVYRNSDIAGLVKNGTGGTAAPACSTSTTNVTATANTSPLNCIWGFALPTSLASTTNAAAIGVPLTSGYFGSDPAAYAIMNGDPTVRYSGLVQLRQQQLEQTRTGLTTALQWKPTENTKITADALYAELDYDNHNYYIGPFGNNRQNENIRAEIGLNNATTGLRPFTGLTGGNYFTDRRGVYSNACVVSATRDCSGTAGSPTVGVLPTSQYWNGTGWTSVAGVLGTNTFSTNPYNLDVYDYYNNPNSPGYNAAAAAADHRGILNYDQIVGKPHTTVQAAHITPDGYVDYSVLNRVDWITQDTWATNNTTFKQYDLKLEQRVNDKLKFAITWGQSSSDLTVRGGRIDLYALDQNGYTFDERGSPTMPLVNPGFDVANAANWDLVKGYAGISLYNSDTHNTYDAIQTDFNYRFDDRLNFDFGGSVRKYGFDTWRGELSLGQVPTVQELNKYGTVTGKADYAALTIAKLGKVLQFGKGLDMPAGTPTSWYTPDRDTVDSYLNFSCNCINQFGDWRVFPRVNDTQSVEEKDTGVYVQGNFDYDVLGRPLRGNLGVRVVKTDIFSLSQGTTGVFNGAITTGTNSYTDTLPSLNLAYEITDNLFVRFAASKTMARPSLGNLAPGVTAISIGTTPVVGSPPSLTVGNPKLKPFRSTNIDLNVEWYMNKDALLSVAFFHKDLSSFPRQQKFEVVLKDALASEQWQTIHDSLTPVQQAYMDSDDRWNLTTFQDGPGGIVNGLEIQYQQGLDFILPSALKGFGIQANATHIESSLNYLSQAGVWSKAPWPFAAPNALNFTLYYERGPFEGRVSYSWRDSFAKSFPQSGGTCSPGLNTNGTGGACSAPYTDFQGTDATKFADAKFSYKVNSNIKAELAVQNIFGATQSNWAYNPHIVNEYLAGAGTIVTFGVRMTY